MEKETVAYMLQIWPNVGIAIAFNEVLVHTYLALGYINDYIWYVWHGLFCLVWLCYLTDK